MSPHESGNPNITDRENHMTSEINAKQADNQQLHPNQTFAVAAGSGTAQQSIFEELFERYPTLIPVRDSIWNAYLILESCYESGGKLLIVGNGGSCADSEHIVGELMKGFVKRRQLPEALRQAIEQEELAAAGGAAVSGSAGHNRTAGLAGRLQGAMPAITLTGHPALATAFLNDVDGEMIYAQQVCGYGAAPDVLMGITTSGNAKNIDYAVTVAKAKGMKVIGLTGKDGGTLGQRSDAAVIVPESETYRIQELHLPIYHTLCLMLEERFFA